MERCPYCFKPLPEDGECSCHYEDSRNARIEEALRPGSIVGACYQIGAVLGQGGFGITYRGFDLDMQKIVAIKEFYPQGMVVRYGAVNRNASSDGRSNYVRTMNTEGKDVFRKSLDLFYREAVALGKLDKQPNVVHAHRIFRENGTAYIVMEFVEGQSLKAMIQERGKIPEEELIPMLEPVLTALDKVHREGILHRDIAPDNIMIENGEPILLDFGAARVEEGHHSSLVIGKRGFSAYEQMAGGVQDRRSDIYAMGATYYSALSGIPPQDAAIRMMKDEVVPLKELVPGISENTSDAVAKAMALYPDDRWNTAAEFRDALKNNTRNEEKENIYRAAVQLMKSGTEEGYSGAQHLFGQIPDYKDSENLSKECRQKIAEIQEKSRQKKKDPTGGGTSVSDEKKKTNKLPIILGAVIALGIALFFILRSVIGPEKPVITETATPITRGLPDISEHNMTMTVQEAERSTSTAAAIQTETQQAVDAEMTAIALDLATGTAYYHETETKQAEPTITPVPPTQTPKPASTNTSVPTATDTPIPTPTDTPVPTSTNKPKSTNTPVPSSTNTLIPTSTNTPVPSSTNTSIPTATNTPVPSSTNTLIPTSTNTPMPTLTNTPIPTATNKPKPTNTTEPTAADPNYLAKEGETAYQNGDYDKAFKYLIPAAAAGNTDAQYRLGYMYFYGKGTTQSYNAALKYFQPASDKNNTDAQCYLGYMYYYGYGVDQSLETAAKYYKKAADLGNDVGQLNLGYMYEFGEGVEQSWVMAQIYYQMAAAQGNETAAEYSDILAARLTQTAEPTSTPRPASTKTPVPTATKTPVPAATATPRPTEVKTPKPAASGSGLQIGSTVSFGRYEQDEKAGADPIEWQVLAVKEGGLALVISKYALEAIPYHETQANITWENSDLRKWLNDTFYNSAFIDFEKNRIQYVMNSNPDNPSFGTDGGNDTNDKIFLLSIDEVQKYLPSVDSRRCEATYHARLNGVHVDESNIYSWWWLRSPGFLGMSAAYVDNTGGISEDGNFVILKSNAVRPAFWLNM